MLCTSILLPRINQVVPVTPRNSQLLIQIWPESLPLFINANNPRWYQKHQKATPTLFLPGIICPGIGSNLQSKPVSFSPNVVTLVKSILFSFLSESIENFPLITSLFTMSLLGLEPGVQVLGTAASLRVLSSVLNVLATEKLARGDEAKSTH
jgi:hypothetical protein